MAIEMKSVFFERVSKNIPMTATKLTCSKRDDKVGVLAYGYDADDFCSYRDSAEEWAKLAYHLYYKIVWFTDEASIALFNQIIRASSIIERYKESQELLWQLVRNLQEAEDYTKSP